MKPNFVCPVCKGILSEDKGVKLRCEKCRKEFALKANGVIDFRVLQAGDSKEWNLEEIEKAYRDLGDYEDNFAWAAKDGWPREVEEYRHAHLKGRVQEWLKEKSFQNILEVGCGSGYFLFKIDDGLSRPAEVLAGLEVSHEQILKFCARGRRLGREAACLPVLANAETIPFPTESFDLVLSSEVIEHILKPEEAVREIYRILKPGGIFCLTTPSHVPTEFWRWFFFVPRVIRRVLSKRPVKGMDTLAVYDKPLTTGELKKILKDAGFETVSFERNIFLPHESYFPAFPLWLSNFFLSAGGFLEKHARFLDGWLGLHFVAQVRKPCLSKQS